MLKQTGFWTAMGIAIAFVLIIMFDVSVGWALPLCFGGLFIGMCVDPTTPEPPKTVGRRSHRRSEDEDYEDYVIWKMVNRKK